MDASTLLARYGEARAPRYTSYPTALQFSSAVGAAQQAAWLASLDASEPVSLYVHIPFCRRLCWYCGCNTRAVNRPEPVSDYVALLVREIATVAERIGRRLPVSSLHLGGGSPDSLSLDDLDLLFGALRSAFDLRPDAAIAAELDPSHVGPIWIARAARLGLNRASLGVQDFSTEVQLAVNRLQSFEVVADAVAALRANGVASVNLDLMYGLPRQTVADVIRTAELAAGLSPERLAVFGYAHVPWLKAHQRLIQERDLPGPAGRLRQAEAATGRLVAAGYRRIGLDHFAKPGDPLTIAFDQGSLKRNFQGYTTDRAEVLIGLGASSISRLPQGYVQNHAGVNDWRLQVMEGRLPGARGVAF
ncbi:MAG: oxygen-independent coproporphyrinogen oxidase, partial [Caulobacteraceae bacterium]|nr:oxygen-independent coproporphyrinogen oxidase [Caulobacteraceae bacterium]